jgi:hypothetical protein
MYECWKNIAKYYVNGWNWLVASKPTENAYLAQLEEMAAKATTTEEIADADASDGVEEQVSVCSLQTPIKPKRRKRKSKHERASPAATKKKKGGARLIRTHTEAVPNGPNNRTCLLESVLALVPTETKDRVRADLLPAMPADGDTSVADITNALSVHNLSLVPVSGEYIKQGGAPFYLLQERGPCKLVIRLRLTDLDGEVLWHFVAFDGDIIHDRPHLAKINNTHDRKDPAKSKLAFGKLFQKTEFLSWQIAAVFRLCITPAALRKKK